MIKIKYLLDIVMTVVCLTASVKDLEQVTMPTIIEDGIYTFDIDAEDTTMYYADENALLEAYGFMGCAPFYQYYDEMGRIYMEFYWDEQRDLGCGLRYRYYSETDEVEEVYGFGFRGHSEETWNKDMYATVSVYGDTGESYVENYREYCEYTEDGRVNYYISSGEMDMSGDIPEEVTVLEIDYVYKDDGTLASREYSHNSWIFGTTYTTLVSYFDEKERLIYEYAYVTHGCLEYFYIYTDETDKPTYCLCLDSVGWGGLSEFSIYK